MSQPGGRIDPFLIAPELWFAVLCEQVDADAAKRLTLTRVFSRIHTMTPPGWEGSPFAGLRAVLAAGFAGGVGEFEVDIERRDVDERGLWQRNNPWVFRVGPGTSSGAMFAEQVEYFFRDLGNYYFVLRLRPPGLEYRVRLEVAPAVAGPNSEESAR